MTAPRPPLNSMRNKIRAEIRQSWKGLSRRELGCRLGKRNRLHMWLLASDMPAIILRVIARELAKGERVQIGGVGVIYSRMGGTTTSLQGARPGHKILPPRRVVQVRFSRTLAAQAGDGTRYSLKFKPSPLLKKAIQPGGPPLRLTKRKAARPAAEVPAPPSALARPTRPAVPLAEIIIR